MAKHAITPQWADTIRQFANRLAAPAVQGYVGSAKNGTNHLRRLRKAYEQGGRAAVVAYLKPYAAFLTQTA